MSDPAPPSYHSHRCPRRPRPMRTPGRSHRLLSSPPGGTRHWGGFGSRDTLKGARTDDESPPPASTSPPSCVPIQCRRDADGLIAKWLPLGPSMGSRSRSPPGRHLERRKPPWGVVEESKLTIVMRLRGLVPGGALRCPNGMWLRMTPHDALITLSHVSSGGGGGGLVERFFSRAASWRSW